MAITTYYVKITIGFLLLIWVLFEFHVAEHVDDSVWDDPAFKLFACNGGIILLLWMWVASIAFWQKFAIAFTKLLNLEELDYRYWFVMDRFNYSGSLFDNSVSKLNVEPNLADSSLVNEVVEVSGLYLFSVAIYIHQVAVNARLINSALLEVAAAGGHDSLNTSENTAINSINSYYEYVILIPISFTVYFTYKLLCPWQNRKLYFKTLFKTVAAPWYPVNFVDSYIGDILTSLVRVFTPLEALFVFTVYYCIDLGKHSYSISNDVKNPLNVLLYRHEVLQHRKEVYNMIATSSFMQFVIFPFVSLFPLWVRFLHCLRRAAETGKRFPHYTNAAKYASAFCVIAFASFRPQVRRSPLWIGCFIFTTVFQFTWDIFMDWGLIAYNKFGLNEPPINFLKRFRLRSTKLLGEKWVCTYTFIAVFNLVLRFSWTLTLLPDPMSNAFVASHSVFEHIFTYLTPLLAATEIVRRMVWGFLRLEWEHWFIPLCPVCVQYVLDLACFSRKI
jgi:hypothetical protein